MRSRHGQRVPALSAVRSRFGPRGLVAAPDCARLWVGPARDHGVPREQDRPRTEDDREAVRSPAAGPLSNAVPPRLSSTMFLHAFAYGYGFVGRMSSSLIIARSSTVSVP